MAKKALLVGVNKYKNVRSLNGCINDVRNMADILTSFYGFSSDEIRSLTDEAVTRNNLMNRFDWLLDGVQAGDLLLFHFSGHGSRIQDRDGDELDDGMDEILCLYDMDFRNPDSYLLDDDFNDIIDRLPKGVYLTVCLDSCHSGTATRDIEFLTSDLGIPIGERKLQPRFIEPPADIALRSYSKSVKVNRLGSKIKEDKVNTGGGNDVESKHILLAGCMDDQTSVDANINNDYNGAFTYNLCKTIRDTRGLITCQDLITKVRNSLAFNSFSQIPQLNGNKELRAMRFLSASIKDELTCEYGHLLVYKEGHPAKGCAIPEKPAAESSQDLKKKEGAPAILPKVVKRIHVSTKRSKCAISRDIILPSTSEFIGTIRDLSELAKSKDSKGCRNELGDTYQPGCLDFLEGKDFQMTHAIEFCPNEQRSLGVEEVVKPIQLAIRCNPDEETVLLSREDGIWTWHFKDEKNPHGKDLIINNKEDIRSFTVPFKVQDTTTRGLWSNVVYVFKFAKDWIQDGSSAAICAMLNAYEKNVMNEGFKRIDPRKGFVESLTQSNPISDWSSIKDLIKDNKRALLFIHGTASSLAGGYEHVQPKILETLAKSYPLILGYDHFTLSKTPEENANNMLDTLKKSGLLDTGLKFDVITHSRGGLVLRSFVELVDGCRYVDKVIMVACPAGGTNLANPGKWTSLSRMINLLTNIFFFTGGVALKIFFNIAGGLVKFAASKLEDPHAVPGVWAMNPCSDFIKKLNQSSASTDGAVTYNTIGSNYEPSSGLKGGVKDNIIDSIADAFFGDPNDLIVDTDKMVVPWPRGINSGKNFTFDPNQHVYHLNYFAQAETYRKFSEVFGVELSGVI